MEYPFASGKEATYHDYQPVEDLRELCKRVGDIHPTVPNPYTLLSSLPPKETIYTVLDLKEAFFSCLWPLESNLCPPLNGLTPARDPTITDLD